jgi:membrane peptidoglycan carboxypeptidase
VPLYDALAHSYNQATIRLGMTVGVPEVHRHAQKIRCDARYAQLSLVVVGTA